jgi:Ran GTPase-activating protein (RanGAP) involved in mRNA processing and transport
MLRNNSTLTTLKLGHNGLSTRSGITIIESLVYNTTLQNLDLSENSLGTEVGLGIGQVLQLKNSLSHLNLGHNKLGPRGISAIADALKVCLNVLCSR